MDIIPEIGGVDIAIAVGSAVAGAAAQMPRIMRLEAERKILENELVVAKEALDQVCLTSILFIFSTYSTISMKIIFTSIYSSLFHGTTTPSPSF